MLLEEQIKKVGDFVSETPKKGEALAEEWSLFQSDFYNTHEFKKLKKMGERNPR